MRVTITATVLAAMLSVTSVAYAQTNDSTISQLSDGNTADVTQTLGTDGLEINQSSVEQLGGAGNDATVSQTLSAAVGSGGANSSEIKQDGDLNTADVMQTGSGNAENGPLSLTPDVGSKVSQKGSENSAIVKQTATVWGDNVSDIKQTGDLNKAEVNQTANSAGGNVVDNESSITQDGNNNDAKVMQTSAGTTMNFSDIEQKGDGDKANVTQDGTGSTDNMSFIKQEAGTGNMATVDQSGASLTNLSDVHQKGVSNTATVMQK